MKALIQGERVAQIVDDENAFPVHKDLKWVACDATVSTAHTYDADNDVFIAPLIEAPEPVVKTVTPEQI